MIVKKAVFFGSYGTLSQLPRPHLPEVAFAGRSNVGKSSLINKLLGSSKLAKTSSKPGKTRTLNFYRVNDVCYFVDLPGYGFSRVSKRERAHWRDVIESYLLDRETLRLLILIIDARHGLLANDEQMLTWLLANGLPHIGVLTKADKLGRSRLADERRKLESHGRIPEALFFSAVNGMGKKEIWRIIDSAISVED